MSEFAWCTSAGFIEAIYAGAFKVSKQDRMVKLLRRVVNNALAGEIENISFAQMASDMAKDRRAVTIVYRGKGTHAS